MMIMRRDTRYEEQEWDPKTKLGKQVAAGEITLEEIFKQGKKIKEPEIVDKLLPGLQNEVIFVGGSPGKGGGIRRTPTRRTVRMHRSGRRYRISAVAVVGNENGYLGVGKSQSSEHRTAVDKAIQNAKLSIIPIRRGCGSWECACGENHSIPIEITGKAGSIRVRLIPAPKGIGLAIHDEAKKIARLSGIKDVWSKSYGETRSRLNYTLALYDAFRKMNRMKFESDEISAVPEIQELVEEIEKEEQEELEEEKEEAEDYDEKEAEKETSMGFHDSVVPQIFEGKTKTYRLREHNIKTGDTLDFENSQTGEIFGKGKIKKIEKTTVGEIDLKDKAHGTTYKKVEELIDAFKRHYPDREITPHTPAFIYTYKFTPAEKEKKKTEKNETKGEKGE